MFRGTRWSRKFELEAGPIGDGYVLAVRDIITEIGSHRVRVVTRRHGMKLVVTRLIVSALGQVIFGPVEDDRTNGYEGDWLPPLYAVSDFIDTLLITSPYF